MPCTVKKLGLLARVRQPGDAAFGIVGRPTGRFVCGYVTPEGEFIAR
jgi:hypothetical protein